MRFGGILELARVSMGRTAFRKYGARNPPFAPFSYAYDIGGHPMPPGRPLPKKGWSRRKEKKVVGSFLSAEIPGMDAPGRALFRLVCNL